MQLECQVRFKTFRHPAGNLGSIDETVDSVLVDGIDPRAGENLLIRRGYGSPSGFLVHLLNSHAGEEISEGYVD